MTSTSPTGGAYQNLVYHSGIGKLVLINTANYTAFNTANISLWEFNGSNNWSFINGFPAQNPTNTQPGLRTLCSAAFDNTNIVLYGGQAVAGFNYPSYLDDTWLLSSAGTWTKSTATDTSISAAPQARAMPYMCQWNTTSVLMFGGFDNHILFTDNNSIFTYTEAGGWGSSTLTAIPPSRKFGSFASNGTTKALFGAGAKIDGSCLTDWWLYTSGGWSQLVTSGLPTTSGSPSARHSMSLCWNGTSWIAFGGQDQGGNYHNETFSFNDTTGAFTQLSLNNSPSIRGGAAMCYLSGFGVVLWGGKNGSAYTLNDTWYLPVGGTAWIQL